MKHIVFCLITALFFSCSPAKEPVPPASTAEFDFVDTNINDNTKKFVTELYAVKGPRDTAAMRQLCLERKRNYTDDEFLYIVFFDAKENAKFAGRSDAYWAYGFNDENTMRHILAYFNDGGILDLYEKNMWESPAIQVPLK